MEFGEMIEPDTRAFWSNYDEYEEGCIEPQEVSWKWMDEDRTEGYIQPFKHFYVVEGSQVLNFVQKTVLKKLTPMCQVDNYKLSVYQLDPMNVFSDYICVCEDNDLDQTARVTELLTPWLSKAEKVYLFPFQSAYTYNTDIKPIEGRCFIRTLANFGVDVESDDIEPMEDCNIVNGISAGAASWRHIKNMPFVCYNVYMDCLQIDSMVGTTVLKVFHQLGLKCDSNYSVKPVNKSNLYM